MKLGRQPSKWLVRKNKIGFRDYSIGTVAFYGLDDRRASKVAVAVFTAPDTEPAELRRWFADTGDIRKDLATSEEISLFLQSHGVRSVGMTETILGCPHEKGIDYPSGEACPHCPFLPGASARLARYESQSTSAQ